MTFRSTFILAAFSVAVLAPAALAQKGGTITGTVTWDGGAIPKNTAANVDKDKDHCLSKGAILQNEFVIDAKTKGVANVMIWVIDAANPSKKIPSKKKPPAIVEIEQPCCAFVPRVVFITPDQRLKVVNNATIAHNIRIDGGADGPNLNPLMPPKTSHQLKDAIKPRLFPIPYSCSIHGWMRGFLFAVPSPYAEVTALDAKGKKPGEFKIEGLPPGKYKLMAWHEKAGFLLWAPGTTKDNRSAERRGMVITVKAGGAIVDSKGKAVTKLNIPLKPAE
jgi:hypothetical protein